MFIVSIVESTNNQGHKNIIVIPMHNIAEIGIVSTCIKYHKNLYAKSIQQIKIKGDFLVNQKEE